MIDPHVLARGFEENRRALTTYVTRLVSREDIAEEIVQQAAVKALEQTNTPQDVEQLRPWLFTVATNLALDHLRKHSTWRETILVDTRSKAITNADFVLESRLLRGSSETKTIAKDHLAVCFACTLRNLHPEESAALLLKEIYDFTVDEVAAMIGASFGQAKAWIQSARAKLSARYATSCALVTQQGVCFQCVELDQFFDANQGDPLANTDKSIDARLSIVKAKRETKLGPWHQKMMRLVDEVLDEEPELAVRKQQPS